MSAENIALFSIIIVFILVLLTFLDLKIVFEKILGEKKGNVWIPIFGVLGAIFVAIGIFAPYIFTNIRTTEKLAANNIGDTMGGTMSPFIAIAGVIFTFLAFYIQKIANDEIKEQFKIQHFENRLYKLLDIYQDNVSRMVFESRMSKKTYTNKSVYPSIFSHFNKLKSEIKKFAEYNNLKYNSFVENDYKVKLKSINSDVNIEKWILLELSYIIFYFGVAPKGRENILSLIRGKYNQDIVIKLINYLSFKPSDTSKEVFRNWKNLNLSISNYEEANKKTFDKYYNGFQNTFGHYFRHLFLVVKFINDNKELNYNEKWEYSKLLRTQLSNHEQLFFFLNSISILGRNWELNILSKRNEDLNNRLITKYDLIKNIPIAYREDFEINKFYPNVEFEDNPILSDYRSKLENYIYK